MSLLVRILLTILVLILLPGYAAAVGAQNTTPQTSPLTGPGQTHMAVTGTGARTGIPVQGTLISDGGTEDGAITMTQVDPEAGGLPSTTMTAIAALAAMLVCGLLLHGTRLVLLRRVPVVSLRLKPVWCFAGLRSSFPLTHFKHLPSPPNVQNLSIGCILSRCRPSQR